MAELERELSGLAAAVEFPPAPDLAGGVRARLGERRRPRYRRLVAIAVALVAVAVGAAFAVPDSRSALLRFLGLKGVTVIQVDEVPAVGPGPLVFGERATLARARRELGFKPLLPRLGRPDDIRIDSAARELILLYRGRIRMSEFQPGGSIITKLTKVGGAVEPVRVNGGHGLWVPEGHLVFELGRQPRLAGNTLLWEQAGLTLRLEGRLTEAQALKIAASVR